MGTVDMPCHVPGLPGGAVTFPTQVHFENNPSMTMTIDGVTHAVSYAVTWSDTIKTIAYVCLITPMNLKPPYVEEGTSAVSCLECLSNRW